VPEPTEGNPLAAFGANEWLVDEMYEQYQKDPESVDPAWWDFFKTYRNGAAPAAAAAKAPATATRPIARKMRETSEPMASDQLSSLSPTGAAAAMP
jgi:2-oxoglutarate dehydrogenase E1 component